jgi:hypothetical protein
LDGIEVSTARFFVFSSRSRRPEPGSNSGSGT